MDGTKSDDESEIFFDCESPDQPQACTSSMDQQSTNVKTKTYMKSEVLNAAYSNDNNNKDAGEVKDTSEENVLPESLLDNLNINELKDEKKEEEEEEVLSEEEIEKLRIEAVDFKVKGNGEYKERKFAEAHELYSEGLRICPKSCTKERSVLLGNRCACLMALQKKDMAIADCNAALKLDPNYLKVLLRRAQLLEETEKLDEALADYKKIVEIDPTIPVARAACMRLPKIIEVRNEKMKKEMLGQLKSLGNKLLSPFGLSTNNFKMEQNENGAYNVQFVQNQPPPRQYGDS